MKQLRSLGAACLLALALTVSASAGHIQTGVTDPPPPPQSSATTTTGTDTASEASDSTTDEAQSSSLVEAALNLISNVLALF